MIRLSHPADCDRRHFWILTLRGSSTGRPTRPSQKFLSRGGRYSGNFLGITCSTPAILAKKIMNGDFPNSILTVLEVTRRGAIVLVFCGQPKRGFHNPAWARGLSGDSSTVNRWVADVLALHDVDDVFGDVRGMVSDALEVFGNENQFKSRENDAGISHHVRK